MIGFSKRFLVLFSIRHNIFLYRFVFLFCFDFPSHTCVCMCFKLYEVGFGWLDWLELCSSIVVVSYVSRVEGKDHMVQVGFCFGLNISLVSFG